MPPVQHLNAILTDMYVTGGMFKSNGTTSMPKSVPRLVLDKVRLVFVSEVVHSNVLVQNVPNKSLSQELNIIHLSHI